jgi:hypothetical protein
MPLLCNRCAHVRDNPGRKYCQFALTGRIVPDKIAK